MSAATHANGARTPRVVAAAVQVDSRAPGLMDALLAISAEAPKLKRTEPGQIQNRTYLYVTLDALLDVVVPILIAHDLVWVTRPTMTEDGRPALRYRLTHVPSGESEEDVMPLMGAQDSQGVGSALTYARRYALLAVLNLAPGEDDDGRAASPIAPVDRYADAAASQSGSTVPAAQPQAVAPKAGGRPASVKQRDMLRKKAAAAKLTDSQLADVVLLATGNEPRRMAEEQAGRWLGMGLERLPSSAVDAVIAGIAGAGAQGSQA